MDPAERIWAIKAYNAAGAAVMVVVKAKHPDEVRDKVKRAGFTLEMTTVAGPCDEFQDLREGDKNADSRNEDSKS